MGTYRPSSFNFYPRPPRGGRPKEQVIGDVSFEFLSTPSARRATSRFWILCSSIQFLSTPSARRATFHNSLRKKCRCEISIHALREEGDLFSSTSTQMGRISIHALREEGDAKLYVMYETARQFLSTPSARRATGSTQTGNTGALDFYPRPPRGGRPMLYDNNYYLSRISIHALREEGDITYDITKTALGLFLSTPSARRATSTSMLLANAFFHFYPRPPRGGRPASIRRLLRPTAISIHALREEGDFADVVKQRVDFLISIHALREEGDGRGRLRSSW